MIPNVNKFPSVIAFNKNNKQIFILFNTAAALHGISKGREPFD